MQSKWKITVVYVIILLICGGCQKTPQKNAVISKANGLNENVMAKKIPDSEKKQIILPKKWIVNEQRGEESLVQIDANLNVNSVEIGNTPIIEVSPREFKEEDLRSFSDYFANGRELLEKKEKTRQLFEEEIEDIQKRIDNKEGAYGDVDARTRAENYLKMLKEQMKEAPTTQGNNEQNKIEFGEDYMFEAEIGAEREALIQASTFNKKVGTYSSFSYRQGKILHEDEFNYWKNTNDFWITTNGESSFAGTAMKEILEKYELALNKEDIESKYAKKLAEQLLKDLGISNMKYVSENKIVWFSKDDYPNYYYGEDAWFMVDWSRGKSGYKYTFAPEVNGLAVKAPLDNYGEKKTPEETYKQPFAVESISVCIIEDGVIEFEWNNMAKKINVIAENTNLLPFEKIQERLFDHLFYIIGAPDGIKTKFNYEILDVNLGYTYIPAYENLDCAWMVPAWFFTSRARVDDTKVSGLEYWQDTKVSIFNALDGSYISKFYEE